MAARTLDLATFRVEQEGRVLTARFENPPLNFFTAASAADLLALVQAVQRDVTVGAVILTGAPEGRFITHFDIGELVGAAEMPAPPLTHGTATLVATAGLISAKLPGGRAIWERLGGRLGKLGLSLAALSRLHAITAGIRRSGAVWIAAINGPCLGAGLELACACDLRIAEDVPAVRLGQPEVLGGIIPGAGGTQLLPRLIGAGPALQLILDGASLDASAAERAGLVAEVADPGKLLAVAGERAHRLARRPRAAVAAAKRSVHTGAALPLPLGLLVESGGLIVAGKDRATARLARAYGEDLTRLGDSPFVAEPGPWEAGER